MSTNIPARLPESRGNEREDNEKPQQTFIEKWQETFRQNPKGWKVGAIVVLIGVPTVGFLYASATFNADYMSSLGQSESEKTTLWFLAVCLTLMVMGLPSVLEIIKTKAPQLARPIWATWSILVLFSFTCAVGYSAKTRSTAVATNESAIQQRQLIQQRVQRTNDALKSSSAQPSAVQFEQRHQPGTANAKRGRTQ